MIVIGAGLSGLIAANLLHEEVDEVWEAQNHLPNNHNAILRFRSEIISLATNIPFRKVEVMKAVERCSNEFADMVTYSRKVTGLAQSRSILSASGKMSERYIAPPDLVNRLYDRVNHKVSFAKEFAPDSVGTDVFISTMPMPALMRVMEYPEYDYNRFSYRSGFVVRGQLPNFNAYGTVYIPDPSTSLYRVSVTGNELYAECVGSGPNPEKKESTKNRILIQALYAIGLGDMMEPDDIIGSQIKSMQYAKINPVDEKYRKDFILWASERRVYSLGRFAVWRPSLLLDDLVNDINVIRRLHGGDKTPNYQLKKV